MTLTSIADCSPVLDESLVAAVLSSVVNLLNKEVAIEHRGPGREALLAWLALAKRRRLDGSNAYEQALAAIVKVASSKSTTEASQVLQSLVKNVHPDVLEDLTVDLWRDKTFPIALAKFAETAATKKSFQLEGLVGIYLTLLYSHKQGTAVPTFACKAVTAGASTQIPSSFLFAPSMLDALASNRLLNVVMCRMLALYTQMAVKRDESGLDHIFVAGTVTAASHALVACALNSSFELKEPSSSWSTEFSRSLDAILTYEPQSAEAFAVAILSRINELALAQEKSHKERNATREARETETELPGGSPTRDWANTVRRLALSLIKHCRGHRALARVMVLMHMGSSLRSEGRQRDALLPKALCAIREVLLPIQEAETNELLSHEFAQEVLRLCVGGSENNVDGMLFDLRGSDGSISLAVYEASISLMTSLGRLTCYSPEDVDENVSVACSEFAHNLCVRHFAPELSNMLKATIHKVEALTSEDVSLFLSPLNTSHFSNKSTDKKLSGRKAKEDDEWVEQPKREMVEKRQVPVHSDTVAELDCRRIAISTLVNTEFIRLLSCIRQLCLSDIEVGNDCLPTVAECVVEACVPDCDLLGADYRVRRTCQETLTVLATCVFEIHEVHARSITQALISSCRKSVDGLAGTVRYGDDLLICALPSPCSAAASVFQEVDNLLDALSGNSFYFLFPVVVASLLGPRTTPGCESSLRILARHANLFSGPKRSDVVVSLRKLMVIGVLELLRHDRSQTFFNPTAYEVLESCYQLSEADMDSGTSFTIADLAPLLDGRGSLGSTNCRRAAMLAMINIARINGATLRNDLLVENRIWLNCFAEDEGVRMHARDVWKLVNGEGPEETLAPPSPLYAAALTPLLSHADASIAHAAASAFAASMSLRPSTVGRNIETLCKQYIDSVPQSKRNTAHSGLTNTTLKDHVPSSMKKESGLSSILKKKSIVPKNSILVGTGLVKTKAPKKKSVHTALLRPKEERTLEQAELENQFKPTAGVQLDEKDSTERARVRAGVLRAIEATTETSTRFEFSNIQVLSTFLVAYGIADVNDDVRRSARNTLSEVVAAGGKSDDAVRFLLTQLEGVLQTGTVDRNAITLLATDKIPVDVRASDRRKEGAIIALGSVAIHLEGSENTAKIDNIVDMLIRTLSTPSEDVQSSAADALAKLMKKGSTQERIQVILANMVQQCLHGDSLALRRGSAYGLAAAVQGSGIVALKKFNIVNQLEDACTSGSPSIKEGSLFAMELLCSRLGLLFEPYVIVLLPCLLKAFSDPSDHVRTAASHAASLIMSRLSAHGVKLVMPAVLTAFNDPAWRTKQASILMLGSMSHLAPKQLASALPKVVPRLIDAFADTHPKVKRSAQEALDEISEVVKNPEVSSISSVLLKALTDPAANTTKALESLIETEFLHAIDAPSLALIVPILHRGLRDRGARNKRFGGLISGNICTMINDPKDFVPYLPVLVPDLQNALLDPIPDVRSTAAKALGSLSRSLGDQILPELRPWLLKKFRDSTCSSAERSGAAQGLTEVLIASGSEIVDETMRNDIMPLRSYPDASTREGVLWMLTFLPPALGQGFTPLIDASLPALISGLSDDSELVRDVALRAGKVLIRSHGKVHVDKILPSIEQSLGDEEYRIRVSSLSLLGDLLSTIGGTTMLKGDGDTQDDIRRAERAQAQIALVLGTDTRRRVLSRLYLARNDGVHAVRQSAIQVWKTVVSVTARTLRDIMPVLIPMIISDLASGHAEKTEVAGRCLGDIVGKLGDSVLPQIIPLLRNALHDGDEQSKRGVCVGLTEVIKCSTKEQIWKYIEIIVKVVQDALSTENENVRKIAAGSFQSLYEVVGYKAFEQVVPPLMVAIEKGERTDAGRRALYGLTSILGVRSRELLPYVIPRLIQRPISKYHAEALGAIADVTANTIHFHFGTIIPAVLFDLSEITEDSEGREGAVRSAARSICSSVNTSGLYALVNEVISKCGSDKPEVRRESCAFLEVFVIHRAEKQDFYDHLPTMLRELLYRLNDDNVSVLKATHGALSALSRHVSAEELVKHIEFIRNLLASMVSDARRRKGGVGDGEFLLPGFNMPKGIEPLLPIYQRGILYGSPSIREVSAIGLDEILAITATKHFGGPIAIKITGPLLRVVGDRNPSNVKVAILHTLGTILKKGGPALRAFVPQFQTTFVKALSDPARQVRMEAIGALSLLMPLSARVDPLIKELCAGALGKSLNVEGSAATVAVQAATLDALAAVLREGGSKAKLPASIESAADVSKQLVYSVDDGIREAAASVLGVSCTLLGIEATLELLRNQIIANSTSNDSNIRHGNALAISKILVHNTEGGLQPILLDLRKTAASYSHDEKSIVREAGLVAMCAAIGRSLDPQVAFWEIESDLLEFLSNDRETFEIQKAIAVGLCVALRMIEPSLRIDAMGIKLIDACLKRSLSGNQRIQFAFNDVLWLVLDVSNGRTGLEKYCGLTMFDSARSMTSLYDKVLVKIQHVAIQS